MNQRFLSNVWKCLLIAVTLLTGVWAYWYDQPSGDAWVVEQPQQIIAGAEAGQRLEVAFNIRNGSSTPRRILGVEAC